MRPSVCAQRLLHLGDYIFEGVDSKGLESGCCVGESLVIFDYCLGDLMESLMSFQIELIGVFAFCFKVIIHWPSLELMWQSCRIVPPSWADNSCVILAT